MDVKIEIENVLKLTDGKLQYKSYKDSLFHHYVLFGAITVVLSTTY